MPTATPPTPELAILIATRNRAELLQLMLASLDVALSNFKNAATAVEVILVDSASTDDTLAILRAWCGNRPQRRVLRMDQPGKARALNAALRCATAPLLAFTDDDVEVDAHWIERLTSFFAAHMEYDAAVGRVRTPPQVTDPDLLARARFFGTLPLYDRGDAIEDTKHLYGCNMVVRAAVLARIGFFNEELGPGASGLHEDGDLARRILAANFRIGYMPDVLVFHAVEESRLTFDFFREMRRRDARSRFVLDPKRSLVSALGHYAGAALTLAWWTLLGNRQRRMRARGRLISHAEMLRLVRQGQPR